MIRGIDVEPVLDSKINNLKQAPESGRYDDQVRKIPVRNQKSARSEAEEGVDKQDVRPPRDRVEVVHEGFEACDERDDTEGISEQSRYREYCRFGHCLYQRLLDSWSCSSFDLPFSSVFTLTAPV